ncbi:25507_t:CDS:2, partial [Gigaspora margarita]
EEEIRECIEAKFNAIVTKQRKRIGSLLDKPHQQIKINRVIKESENEINLIYEPEQVLQEENKWLKALEL